MKLVKPSKWNNCHVDLTGKGPLAYLWIGDVEERHLTTVIGPAALHRIANAILRNVPPPKKRKARR